MPIYNFLCPKCGAKVETLAPMGTKVIGCTARIAETDDPDQPIRCNTAMERTISLPAPMPSSTTRPGRGRNP